MNDVNAVCEECGISTLQKIKLKAAIEVLQPSQRQLSPVLCMFLYHYTFIRNQLFLNRF